METEILNIFEDMELLIKNPNKVTYDLYFQKFCEKNNSFFNLMLSDIENSTNKEEASSDVSNRFIEAIRSVYGNKKGVIKGYHLVDINMFMIQYVFPAILKLDSEYNSLLVENICENWSSTFKGSKLQHTTYETIFNGLKNKFMGITLDN